MKALIIGAGGIAHYHIEALQKIGVTICGIYDIDQKKAEALSSQYKIEALGDPEEMLPEADMVYLLTPPSTRLEYIKLIAKYKKAVFMEKPIAVTLQDALEMEQIILKNQMLSMVGFTQRFRRGYQRLEELIQQGNIGSIVQAFTLRIGPGPGFQGELQESWRTDRKYVCGMTIESLSHDIDFLQSLVGKIIDVKGQVKGAVLNLPEFDNNSDAVIRFQNGAIGTITCSWSSAVAFNMKGIIGTQGAAFLRGDDIWNSEVLVINTKDGDEKREWIEDIYLDGEGYLNEDSYFCECIQKKQPAKCDVQTGRRVLETSLEILNTSFREVN